ncbi:MAG: hypothetical protein R6U19_07695 [Bacteroidales bacterium]
MNKFYINLTLETLAHIEDLSSPIYNICKDNKLSSLKKILYYYFEHGNFKKLRNCGDKYNQELIQICNTYKDSFYYSLFPSSSLGSKYMHPETKIIISNIITTFSDRQICCLNNIISAKFDSLSTRSKNALPFYPDKPITITSLKTHIFDNENFSIHSLKNVGAKSANEIQTFLLEVSRLIRLINMHDNPGRINRELYKAILNKHFKPIPSKILSFCKKYDFTQGIPLFKTIDMLLEHHCIFRDKEKFVFDNTLSYRKDQKLFTLSETGYQIGLTKERIRQIRNNILDRFSSHFSFIRSLDISYINLYSLDTSQKLLKTDEQFINELSENENVNFNIFFINRMLSFLLQDDYSLIGNECKGVTGKAKWDQHGWRSTYLISQELSSVFDFEKLIEDVSQRLNEKITDDYALDFTTYLLDFTKIQCKDLPEGISDIARYLLRNEFAIHVDTKGYIKFPQNAIKPIPDYIYDILKQAHEPLHVNEIFYRMRQHQLKICKSIQSIRGSCQRDPRIIHFGPKSTYGLKEWKDQPLTFKYGSIQDLSEEFLLKHPTPRHINEIHNYVSQFREHVSIKNLFYNLRSVEHQKFIFFQDRHIGLASKTYDTALAPYNPRPRYSWQSYFDRLLTFVNVHNRLPRSTSKGEELQLYRFLNLQIRNFEKLSSSQKAQLMDICHKYNYKKRKSTQE